MFSDFFLDFHRPEKHAQLCWRYVVDFGKKRASVSSAAKLLAFSNIACQLFA
jgi:hypothetical protein